jgi:chemotaxis protein methyltransferase CheR
LDTFKQIAEYMQRTAGISFADGKAYLIEARLTPLAKKWGLASVDQVILQTVSGCNSALAQEVVDALTTNETLFFRDQRPFDALGETILPDIMARNMASKRIRMWSAACSSGQEALSMGMVALDRSLPQLGWQVEILGTDLSSEMVARAKAGEYSHFEVQRGLSSRHMVSYFEQRHGHYVPKQNLKGLIHYREGNLLSDQSSLGQFDVIFLRNVLFYFSIEVKKQVLTNVIRNLSNGGYLVVGATENISGLHPALTPVPGLYGIHKKG